MLAGVLKSIHAPARVRPVVSVAVTAVAELAARGRLPTSDAGAALQPCGALEFSRVCLLFAEGPANKVKPNQ